jgi:hypothetical protein
MQRKQFYKSMTAYYDYRIWQDVSTWWITTGRRKQGSKEEWKQGRMENQAAL